jgi:hypothetical protein
MDGPQAGAAPASASPGPGAPADLAHDALAYARAWGNLVISEAAVARVNIVHLLIGALLVPVLAFGLVLAVDVLLAALVFEFARDWLIAAIAVGVANVAGLVALGWLLRNWWRSLSLPHSRHALRRLWRNDGGVRTPAPESAPGSRAV